MASRWVKAGLILLIILVFLSPGIVSYYATGRDEDSPSLEIISIDYEDFPKVKVQFRLSVKDKKKVKREMVSLGEEGRKADIKSLTVLESGLSQANFILAIDKSTSMWGSLEEMKTVATTVVNELGEQDRLALLEFSSSAVKLICDYTSNKGFLKEKIQSNITATSLSRKTPLYDAVIDSIDLLKAREGPKTLVLLTDGDETSSSRKLNKAISYASKNGVVIHSIGLGDQVVLEDLRELCKRASGQLYLSPTRENLKKIFQITKDEWVGRYRLVYNSPLNAREILNRKLALKLKINGEEYGATKTYHIPKLSFDLNLQLQAIDNYPLQALWVNGEKKEVPADRTGSQANFETTLESGENELNIKVKDRAGNLKKKDINVFFADLKPNIELEKRDISKLRRLAKSRV